jgi:hypothetical protein
MRLSGMLPKERIGVRKVQLNVDFCWQMVLSPATKSGLQELKLVVVAVAIAAAFNSVCHNFVSSLYICKMSAFHCYLPQTGVMVQIVHNALEDASFFGAFSPDGESTPATRGILHALLEPLEPAATARRVAAATDPGTKSTPSSQCGPPSTHRERINVGHAKGGAHSTTDKITAAETSECSVQASADMSTSTFDAATPVPSKSQEARGVKPSNLNAPCGARWIVLDGPTSGSFSDRLSRLLLGQPLRLNMGSCVRVQQAHRILWETDDLAGATPALLTSAGICAVQKPLVDDARLLLGHMDHLLEGLPLLSKVRSELLELTAAVLQSPQYTVDLHFPVLASHASLRLPADITSL